MRTTFVTANNLEKLIVVMYTMLTASRVDHARELLPCLQERSLVLPLVGVNKSLAPDELASEKLSTCYILLIEQERRLKFFCFVSIEGAFAVIEMDSYQFDADNLTFDGISAANSETLPSEHVPLVPGNGATGTEVSADSVSVPLDSDGVDGEQDVVLGDQVEVERDVRVQLVDNDILYHLHCSCGRKREAAEVITAYMLNHSHQGESWFCQAFCGISVMNDASSSHHVTARSNMITHSTGIRTIAICTHSLISASAGSGDNAVDVAASCTQTMIPESEGELEEDEDAEQNLTVENEECEGEPEEDEDAEQNLTVENEGSDGEQEEVGEDDEQNGLAVEDEAIMELLQYIRIIKAGLRVQAFYLSIKLHKYESAKSSLTEQGALLHMLGLL